MSENKKLNELESEKVSGGSNTDEKGDPIEYVPKPKFEHNGRKYYYGDYFICEKCGKPIKVDLRSLINLHVWDEETGKFKKIIACGMCAANHWNSKK
ncbi:MAG: hypothetical protein Q4D57_06010 [Clostridia bacterium]|nr:hypothetical protein [Clostridia bacterium]